MSGSGPDTSRDAARAESDLLAAEYVLGTLEADDRAALAREAERDPVLQDSIEAWERRLAPLGALAPPVTPPDALWSRIQSTAWGGVAGPRPATTTTLSARPRRGARIWQATTAAGFALAAAVAGIAVLHTPPANPVTALLPIGKPATSVFVAETTPDGGLRVTPVGAVSVAPDRSLELWLLKDGETVPKPLGVLPAGGTQLAAGTVRKGVGAKILISLEPRGGSPTGLPTGPVLWGGAI